LDQGKPARSLKVQVVEGSQIPKAGGPSISRVMWTIDLTPCRSFEDQELEMSKNIDIKNPEIAMCEIPTESKPSDQDVIWIIDPTPCRSFEDRELEMSKNIDINNLEIVMCEIPTESEPSDQDVI
jgi:hypothetical protein